MSNNERVEESFNNMGKGLILINLEKSLDEQLNSETQESLTKWLMDKRNNKQPESIEDIKTYEHYFTVDQLLDFIEKNNIPRDSKILTQRVEDFYYENNDWGVVYKEGEFDELEQYSPVWCPVKYNDDDNLYLDLHY